MICIYVALFVFRDYRARIFLMGVTRGWGSPEDGGHPRMVLGRFGEDKSKNMRIVLIFSSLKFP